MWRVPISSGSGTQVNKRGKLPSVFSTHSHVMDKQLESYVTPSVRVGLCKKQ